MDLSLDKLLADKENLERIFDSLMEGIIAHDKERRIPYFNREAERITGYDRNELIGRDCQEVFGGPLCGARCSFCGEALNTWTQVSYPLNIVARGGEARRVEMSVTGMTDEQGCFVGVLAAFRDVTDLVGLQIRLGKLTSFAGIIGQDSRMLQIYEQNRELATNDYPTHITGETGTGKELVAAAIHHESRRDGGVPRKGGGRWQPSSAASVVRKRTDDASRRNAPSAAGQRPSRRKAREKGERGNDEDRTKSKGSICRRVTGQSSILGVRETGGERGTSSGGEALPGRG